MTPSDSQNPNSSNSYSGEECSNEEQSNFIKTFEKFQSSYQEDNSQEPNTNILGTSKSDSKQALLETNKKTDSYESRCDTEETVTEKPKASNPISKRASKYDSRKRKSVIVGRVWYEDDEIKLLNWVIECQTKEIIIEPSSEMAAFHEFMQNSVSVSKNQLLDKIRRMKSKYLKNDQKWEKTALQTAHERKVFDLSKKIWGGRVVVSVKRNSKKSSSVSISEKSCDQKSNSVEKCCGEKAKIYESLDLENGKANVVESSAKSGKRKVVDQEGSVGKLSVDEKISNKRLEKIYSSDVREENGKEVDQDDNSQKPNTSILGTSKSGSKQALLKTNKKPKSDEENSDTDDSHSETTKKPKASNPTAKQAYKNASRKGKSTIGWRLGYEEDEIKLLNWVIQCQRKLKIDPSSDMAAFHEFMENSVSVTMKQLSDKIRKMKTNYLKNAPKAALANPHEKKVFHLSEKIWGGDAKKSNSVCKSKKSGGEKAKNVDPLDLEKGKGKVVESGAKSGKKKVVDKGADEKISKKRVKKFQSLDLVEGNEKEVDREDFVETKGVGNGMEVNQESFWNNYPLLKEALKVENSRLFVEEGKIAMLRDVSRLGDAWARDMEHKWRAYHAKEAELKVMELDILIERTKVQSGIAKK